jgi:hypothetical protein
VDPPGLVKTNVYRPDFDLRRQLLDQLAV